MKYLKVTIIVLLFSCSTSYASGIKDELCDLLRTGINSKQNLSPLIESALRDCKEMENWDCPRIPAFCSGKNLSKTTSGAWVDCGTDSSLKKPIMVGDYSAYSGNYIEGGTKIDQKTTWKVEDIGSSTNYRITWDGKPAWSEDVVLRCEKDERGIVRWYLQGKIKGYINNDFIQWDNNSFWKKK